jgi:hypothetical protein
VRITLVYITIARRVLDVSRRFKGGAWYFHLQGESVSPYGVTSQRTLFLMTTFIMWRPALQTCAEAHAVTLVGFESELEQ